MTTNAMNKMSLRQKMYRNLYINEFAIADETKLECKISTISTFSTV